MNVETLIKTDEDLFKVLNTPELSLETKIKVVCTYLDVIAIFIESESELIQTTEYYLRTFKDKRPIFLQQRGRDFNIKDLFRYEFKES